MSEEYPLGPDPDKDPIEEPQEPVTPEGNPQEPDPYPIGDPIPGSDPDTEPVPDPEPLPPFPEPGGPDLPPPNVF